MKRLFEGFRQWVNERKELSDEELVAKHGKEAFKFKEYINDWVSGTAGVPTAKKLLEYQKFFQKVNPMPKLPKYLFRGMEVRNQPKSGQSVSYTGKRPASSWSSDLKIAQGFCSGGGGANPYTDSYLKGNIKKSSQHGIILAIDTKHLSKDQIFLWPMSNEFIKEFDEWGDLKDFQHQKEWGILITEPLPIAGINFCGRKGKGFEPTKKINEGMEPFFISEAYRDTGHSKSGHWGEQGSGILFIADNKYFLAKRSEDIQHGGEYGIPGGAVPKNDETDKFMHPWISARRETKEECGSLPPGTPKAPTKFFKNQVDEDFVYYNYVVPLPKSALNWNVKLDNESSDYGWFSAEELPKKLHPGVKWLFKKIGVL